MAAAATVWGESDALAQPQGVIWPSLVAPETYRPPPKRVRPGLGFAEVTSTLPTPRRPDGKPELTGNWNQTPPSPAGPGGLRRMGAFEPDQIILQRASGWNKPIYKPEYWVKVRSLDFSRVDIDPAYNCADPGVPRQNAPTKIVLLDKEVLLINWPVTRIVPIGAERSPTDIDQTTSSGVGVAWWEGDTLVVESVGFNNVSWLQFQGYFHTDLMKVTERIWRQGNLLYYNFTVDDPDVLMEPWTQDTMVKVLNPNPNVRYIEQQPCEPTGIPEDDPYNRG